MITNQAMDEQKHNSPWELPEDPAEPQIRESEGIDDREFPLYQPVLTYAETYSSARRPMRRRLAMVLVATLAAFAVTTWVMVRVEDPAAIFGLGPAPSSVVRAHLAALNRGDLREAYAQFSEKYRGEFPFEAYHEIVASHRRMFRTRRVSFLELDDTTGHTVLEAQMVATDGQRYVARFTLVRAAKRWWIDDVRWASSANESELIRT